MALSALGFFFAGGINNAYALPASPVPVVMTAPRCGAGLPVSAHRHQGHDGGRQCLPIHASGRAG
ncbi:hypothetical protein CFR73_12925 [Novacetimonas maltaceti]|nr:hypothetical protein CFR73_12925 [Novacetimonas maltaceti]